jgi:hypothetical protein
VYLRSQVRRRWQPHNRRCKRCSRARSGAMHPRRSFNSPYLATLRGEEMPHECISSHARKLLAADLQEDSLYPELHISVKLPYQIHEIFLDITMPRLYPSAEALRARVRSETMPSAAIEVTTILFVCPRPPACCSSYGDVL